MKRTVKFICILALLVICTQALTGCAIFDKYKKWEGSVAEVTEDSITCTRDFAAALVEGDFEQAETYLHPNCSPKPDEVEDYINEIWETHDFDFTNEEVSFQFSDFKPELDLEHIQYNVEAKATVGGEELTLTLSIRKDEHGFGIYRVEVE